MQTGEERVDLRGFVILFRSTHGSRTRASTDRRNRSANGGAHRALAALQRKTEWIGSAIRRARRIDRLSTIERETAATIWKRVSALYPQRKYLDPKQILETADEKLRRAGLSRSKVAAIKD